MVWMPLRERIKTMPLVLAGPILRRVEPNSVTVWVALKASCHVILKVLDLSYNLLLFDSQKTIKIGTNLHVVAVTAQAESNVLLYGESYLYDLEFDGKTLDCPGILNALGLITDITYPPFNLPSFALPPHDLNALRIVHGSCRKLHGESLDAMSGLDKMIYEALAQSPKQRPHQLFLTGDQIYADDVADGLLLILMDASDTLLGWSEPLPDVENLDELKPGKRNNLATKIAGLTASIDKFNRITNIDKSHLFTFGEFMMMYLFAWSDVLWSQPDSFPEYTDINQQKSLFCRAEKEFKQEITHLKNFLSTLPKVRRALANIPTYMIFDDHEITDDWNLNMAWCDRVLSKPLGRRILQNGLLAYAICQAWGNTPNQFIRDKNQNTKHPGGTLLKAAEKWFASGGTDIKSEQEITTGIGLPTIADIRNTNPRALPHFEQAVQWHYTIQAPGYEVIFLDTRTLRGFPGKDFDFPALLSEEACHQQIPDCNQSTKQPTQITFIISPGPVVGLPFLEGIQKSAKTVAEKLGTAAWGFDPEAWGLEPKAFEQFLARLASRNSTQRSRVVILSGDVHYSFAARLQYSATQPFAEANNYQNNHNHQTNQELVIVQFTSSSFRNEKREAGGSYSLHLKGFIPFEVVDHHPKAEILGWANSTGEELEIGNYYTYSEELMQYLPWRVQEQPAIVNLVEERTWFRFVEVLKKPEWWYRIDFLSAKLENIKYPNSLHPVNPKYIIAPLPKQDRRQALETYLAMAKNYREYKGLWGHGKEIVGVNNFGEVTFEFDDNKQIAVQTLWWRLDSYEDDKLLEPFPLTRYEISLSFDDKECPMNHVLREVK